MMYLNCMRSALAEEISSSVTSVCSSRNTFLSTGLFPDNFHWLSDFYQKNSNAGWEGAISDITFVRNWNWVTLLFLWDYFFLMAPSKSVVYKQYELRILGIIFKCMEYLLTFCNVDDFNIEMNAIKGHLRNVFFHLTMLQRLQTCQLNR